MVNKKRYPNKADIDLRINKHIIKRLDAVIQKEIDKGNNATRSNLLDIGLCLMFNNPELRDTVEIPIEATNSSYNERFTFTTHSIYNIMKLKSIDGQDKRKWVLPALIYVIEKLEGGKFKELLHEYIEADGVIL